MEGSFFSFLLFCLWERTEESFCYLSGEEIDLNIRSRLECTTHSPRPRVSIYSRQVNKQMGKTGQESQKSYRTGLTGVP